MDGYLCILFLLTAGFNGCNGRRYFDLTKDFHIQKNLTGTKVIKGPDNNGEAIQLTPKVDVTKFSISGDLFAYMVNTITTSDDFSYSAMVYIPELFTRRGQKWPLFVLQDHAMIHNYFGVGFCAACNPDDDAIEVGENKNLKTYLYIEQYKSGETYMTPKALDSKYFKNGTWSRYTVRFRTSKTTRKRRDTNDQMTVTILVNCQKIMDFKLNTAGGFNDYPFNGFAMYGMEMKYLTTSQRYAVRDNYLFPGAMTEAQIINGRLTHDFYSPCDSKLITQVVPPEPTPGDYNPYNSKLLQKILSQDVKPLSVRCTYIDKNNQTQTKYTFETWNEGCEVKKCINKKVETNPTRCYKCKGKYRKNEVWIDESDKCKQYNCTDSDTALPITTEDITCPKLNCTAKVIKNEESCCSQCFENTCENGRIYKEAGCVKKCGDDDQTNVKKVAGCYCPDGMSVNDNGDCILTVMCPCKSGKLVYEPGQAAIRSECSECFCLHGKMNCNRYC